MSEEEFVSICADDCRRWSTDIDDRLDDVRVKDGEDTYRFLFVCAFLLLNFAEQLDAGAENGGRPSKSELH